MVHNWFLSSIYTAFPSTDLMYHFTQSIFPFQRNWLTFEKSFQAKNQFLLKLRLQQRKRDENGLHSVFVGKNHTPQLTNVEYVLWHQCSIHKNNGLFAVIFSWKSQNYKVLMYFHTFFSLFIIDQLFQKLLDSSGSIINKIKFSFTIYCILFLCILLMFSLNLKEIPPHTGIGQPEDTLQSCLYIVPRPPKKDVIHFLENTNKVNIFK